MSRTPLAVALLALLPCLCLFEVFTGALLLPTDWLYRDVEPWRSLKQPRTVQNARIKDAILDGYALDVVSAQAAREGHVLLWNPHAGGGIPHLAAGFSRMLYPPFWVYALLPPEHARSAEVLIHLFLAEAFAFLFLRRLGADTAAALAGAVTFGFTPSIAHRVEIPFILPTLVWFPLLLWGVEGLVTSGRLLWFFGLTAAVALQILPGHYPDIFVHFLGAGVYAVCRLATRGDRATALGRGLLGLAAFVLGACLAAPFLFPSTPPQCRCRRPQRSRRSRPSGARWASIGRCRSNT